MFFHEVLKKEGVKVAFFFFKSATLGRSGGFLQQAPSRTVPLGRDDASSVPGRVRSRRIVAETRRTKKTPDTRRYKKSVISRHRHTGNQVVGCCTVLSDNAA